MAESFSTNADLLDIRTKTIPVEATHSMTVVERYHKPIRRAFLIIRKEAPDFDNDSALQMAVKSINDSVGPDGIVPTLLFFGALPRSGLPHDKLISSTFQRAAALQKATAEMSKHFAKRQVRDALRSRDGPDVSDVHSMLIGSHALVYRSKKDSWEGPYSVLDIEGKAVTLLLPPRSGPTKFRSTVVKPYFTTNVVDEPSENSTKTIGPSPSTVPNRPIDPSTSPVPTSAHANQVISAQLAHPPTIHENNYIDIFLRNAPCNPQSEDSRCFSTSRTVEFNGLIERGVFSLVLKEEAAAHRVYGARFVDIIKNEGKPNAFKKSRLVVQAFNDSDHGLLTHAPTVQRSSRRLLLLFCAIDSNLYFFTRDISQAYVQSETAVQRRTYVRPPAVLDLPPDTLLRVELPLYGLREAGLHWYRTYQRHHTDTLSLKPPTHDPCLLYAPKGLSSDRQKLKVSRGFTFLQTDDTANAGNRQFIYLEERSSTKCDCKDAKFLHDNGQLTFNGATISCKHGVYALTQRCHVQKLSVVQHDEVDKYSFISQRAQGAYIAAVCRPDLSFGFSVCSQYTKLDATATKRLNKFIELAKSEFSNDLKFVRLQKDSLKIAIFADASFASNPDLSSQLGYVIALMDDTNNANIIHYSSVKSKRVTQSVLAAELFAAVHAFDYASTIRMTIIDIFDYDVPSVLYMDSKSLYDGIKGLNSTTEKRLLIDLCMMRQAYELRELSEIIRIPSEQNPSDALTKDSKSVALRSLLADNRLDVSKKSWVERHTEVLPAWTSKSLEESDNQRQR